MSSSILTTLDDYDAIAAAVMETERGRWFLAEYARRNRSADTVAVLEALSGLERRLPAEAPASPALPASVAAEDPVSDEAETLIDLIEAAADRAARIRAELSTAPDPRESIDHALRDCVELDEALGLALEALGKPRPAVMRVADAEPRSPDAMAFAQVAPAIATLGPDQDFGWIDIADFEAEIVQPAEAMTAADGRERDEGFTFRFAPDDGLDEHPAEAGDTQDLAATDDEADDACTVANEIEPAEAAGPKADDVVESAIIPRTAPRPRLPLAWTPGLLDRLTPEERAILFA